jgi:glycosyltransferase involved in cell wall biosynthesis
MMRVLFLQQQPCIRSLKYAVGLRSASDSVRLGFAYQGQRLDDWYGTGDELFDEWFHLGDDVEGGLRAALAAFRPDVVHSHNLPDRLTVLALSVLDGRTPVIHDSHDLQSLRQTPYEDGFPEPADPLELERAAVEDCAALVAVSDEMLTELRARYRLPARHGCFANYALARDLPAELPPVDRPTGRPLRLVYQGTLSTNGGHYDLRRVFRSALDGGGVTIDVYPSRPSPVYEAMAEEVPGLRVRPKLDPRRLLEVLPEYDAGWAVFDATLNEAHLHTALPNKVYEYLGCGLPVVTMGHRAIAGLLARHGVGIDLAGPDDLPALGDQLVAAGLAGLRERVARVRWDLTVEANIRPVVDLYKTVVG